MRCSRSASGAGGPDDPTAEAFAWIEAANLVSHWELREHGAASVAGLVLARPPLPEASLAVDRLRARLATLGSPRETPVPSL